MLLAPGRDVETTAIRIVLDTILKGGQDFEGGGSQWGEPLGAALGRSFPPLFAPSERIHTWPPILFLGGPVPNGPRSQARASSGPCPASLTALSLEGDPRPSRAEAGKSLRLPRFQDLPKTNTLGLIPRFFNFLG